MQRLYVIAIFVCVFSGIGRFALAQKTESTPGETTSETKVSIDEADQPEVDTEVLSDAKSGNEELSDDEAESEPATPEERAQLASAAFADGNDAYNREDYAAASEQYRKAYELRPNWKLQYNIGQCEALLKRHGLALLAFERYLSEGGDDVSLERRAEVTAEVERLRTLVGYLEIIVDDGQPVMIDGIYRGDAPLAGTIPVAVAVEHEVLVGREAGRSVVVHGGQTITVNFKTGKESAVIEDGKDGVVASSDTAASDNLSEEANGNGHSVSFSAALSGKQMKATGITLMATGGAAFLTGVITGAVALKKNNYLKEHCDLPDCDPKYTDDLNTRDHFATATNVLLGSGVALAAVGTVLLIYSRKNNRKESQQISAVIGPDGGGVSATWPF